MTSLRIRQLVAASLVLAVFIALCGAGLEQAFRSSALQAQRSKLEGMVFALLAAAESNQNGDLSIPAPRLPDPRLANPQSGLQAAIVDERGGLIWGSPSLADDWPLPAPMDVGVWDFEDKDGWFSLSFGLRWLNSNDAPRRYTLQVLEDDSGFLQQLRIFRRTLWSWLGGAALTLLLVQTLVLRWSLRPLRKLTHELQGVESGRQAQIDGLYPIELMPLTQALNSMIQVDRNQQTRYRNALGDLAHSLKTPLAILHGLMEQENVDAGLRERLREPVGSIQKITDYQLRKAATAGRRTLSAPLALHPLVDKIINALNKVYAGKGVKFGNGIPSDLQIRADEGDLYELFGNLLDNAAKWCRHQVRVVAAHQGNRVHLLVEDDGAGFPEDAEALLERGVRADNQTPGQGIGLAAAMEIVNAYEGTLTLGESPLGGARVSVIL
ncbi:MAG TPA: ATP-binding protein [Stenotrophobium sp.]|jgi:two-component system sensor histidine kinase PhoQ|nr:ATP-binding protein [Stenotrophobium sp.]